MANTFLEVGVSLSAGDFTLDVKLAAEGPTLVLLGPSGAGKSLTLRCIAGIVTPSAGRIVLNERVLLDRELGLSLSPQSRRVGYVPQDYGLFPHLDVGSNVGFGLRGLPGIQRRARVAEVLEFVGLAGMSGRRIGELSGGQKQRVALARALAVQPDVLLLDEPLAALDAPLRLALLEDLEALITRASVPVVYVTHDRGEAIRLGDEVAVMMAGKVRQTGTPGEVFSSPVDEEVAAFVGVENILAGSVSDVRHGLAVVEVNGSTVESAAVSEPGSRVSVCVRPEEIVLTRAETAAAPSSARNRLAASVRRIVPVGPYVRVELDAGGLRLVALVTRLSLEDLGLEPGTQVVATFKATAVHLIPRR